MIDLRCQDVTAMLAGLPDGSAALIHADPPWEYQKEGAGKANAHYGGLDEATIAEHIARTYRVAATDAYLAVWCTFPKLFEWARADKVLLGVGWQYVTGAAWGKTNGLGVGVHFRGDAEVCLLYKKGKPQPQNHSTSNLWVTGETNGGLWLAPRVGHSEKPQNALRALVSLSAPPDGLVVDCYAGASASLARACRALGRRYVGAELDPARHARALIRLSQQEMAWEGVA